MMELLEPGVLIPWILSMLFGLFVGATPGLTATMAVALIVPISYYLSSPTAGLAMILGASFTAIYAGDIPAIYLRIPGTPASAATTLDGHAMARNGLAGHALILTLFCACLGGFIGVLALMFLAPQLARLGLHFSSYEYFWLGMLGLSLSAAVSTGSVAKGLLSAALGMLISTIGIDVVSGTQRFTYGNADLMSGVGFIPVMIGLFGLSEVLRNVRHRASMSSPSIVRERSGSPIRALLSMWRHKFTILRSSMVGTFVGALPGAGADIAAWAAYGVEQRIGKDAKTFGQGNERGVIAPASAHNGAIAGAWIPALVFGIPGDSVTAIVIGAMLVYNLKPGPLIFQQSPEQVHAIFLIALVTQALLLPCGYLATATFSRILRLPRNLIMTAVVVFSVVGAFALRNSLFDVYIMVASGVLGYYLESQRVPVAPLILGLILGPIVEENLRTGLIKSSGEFTPFFTRPISLLLWLLLALSFLGPRLLVLARSRPRTSAASITP
jgi:TctA family transporter